jgi:hypothetical protein
MKDKKLKVGDRVRIINASMIEFYELNKVGVIVEVRGNDYYGDTYIVDMGRPRREREPTMTCWFLSRNAIELVSKPNEQLLFNFMYEE